MKQNRTFTFPDFRTVYSYAPLYRLQHLKYTLRKFFGKKEIYAFEQLSTPPLSVRGCSSTARRMPIRCCANLLTGVLTANAV